MTINIPGMSIVSKYPHSLDTKTMQAIIEVSGIISHTDRQKLFSMGWKNDVEIRNRFTFDMLLCK